MTFYNHIESVRGIAIDLTNGRKWRGASDKAAVFDALDAARREYMRLSDENDKLRKQYEAVIADYRSEVAKLRELVYDMLEDEERGHNDDSTFYEHVKRANELGVKANL